jgi:hypothetical protein
MYTTNGKATKFPDHSDYVLTIQSLAEELNRPIAACWVKGHQDEDRDYDDLPERPNSTLMWTHWPPNNSLKST